MFKIRPSMKRAVILLSLFLTCCRGHHEISSSKSLITEKAMVVSARREASAIGAAILANGGNAFDAMAATELALAVAYPYAGNLGGGGFMVYRLKSGETGALDYREKAPLSASKDMYLDAAGEVIPGKSLYGATATAVPGTIAGVFACHQRFGKLPIELIIQPVIDLAERGVIVTEKQEERIRRYQPKIIEVSGGATLFAQPFKKSDTIKYPALASTLRRILKNGSDEFYRGETAARLVKCIQAHGGYVTLEDLDKYEVRWREALTFQYKDLNIITMSPPSSGGIALAQIMKMIEPYPVESYGQNTLKYIQLLVEVERRAYADRNYFLGDPDFVSIPQKELLNQDYLKKRMSSFSSDHPTPSTAIDHGRIEAFESNETTHYSIVDTEGNAVSVTTTLNGAYGSKLYCDELGFFLNNEMDDFSAKPGVPNMFGLVGADANSIAPEKRMLSSMTPTIIEREGKLWMVVGTPGGSTIITSVLQTILNVYEFNMSLQEAIDQPRFHHQWLPDVIMMEPDKFEQSLKDSLVRMGYTLSEKENVITSKVNGIRIRKNGKLEAGADKRGDDAGVGF